MHGTVIVGEQIAGRATSVRRSLISMVSSLQVNTLDLAELLYEARENGYTSTWGFSSLAEYAEKELGLKQRKAEYLTHIIKVCRAVGLKREQFQSAGISKLREITRLDPEGSYWNPDTHTNECLDEHIVSLILDHDKMNVQQVKDEVARLLGQTGKDRRVIRSYSTDITTWQEVISKALETARRILGSKGRDDEGNAKDYSEGECYEVICASFLADPNNAPDPEEMSSVSEEPQAPPTLPMESI